MQTKFNQYIFRISKILLFGTLWKIGFISVVFCVKSRINGIYVISHETREWGQNSIWFQEPKIVNNFHINDLFSEKSESSHHLECDLKNIFSLNSSVKKSETSLNSGTLKNEFFSLNCSLKKMKVQWMCCFRQISFLSLNPSMKKWKNQWSSHEVNFH